MGGIRTDGPFKFYRYTPSVPVAIVCIVLFSLTTLLHSYQLFRTRTWIMLPFLIGGICESIGFIGRILSSHEAPQFTVGPFLLQAMLLLWGPAWFAASVYMCLGRIIRATGGEQYSWVRPSLLTGLFVSGDVFGLVLQGIGSGVMTAGTLQDYYNGSHIVVAGLAVMVTSFGLFVMIALRFDMQMRRNPTPEAQSTALNWRRDLLALYAVSALIFVRSTFRLVEYAQGNSGSIQSHEWTFYVFDSLLMLVVMVILNVIHPSHIKASLYGGSYSRQMGLKFDSAQVNGEDRRAHDSDGMTA